MTASLAKMPAVHHNAVAAVYKRQPGRRQAADDQGGRDQSNPAGGMRPTPVCRITGIQ
jgi:hypothetical protein